jgi:hypothetical protein
LRCRELAAAEEVYSAKQRLVEGYGADRKAAELRQLSEQLAELKEKRDACNRVRVELCGILCWTSKGFGPLRVMLGVRCKGFRA